MSRSILMVVTSHDRIDAEHPTGIWFEEFAIPFALFRAKGYQVTVASPKGGTAPIDPRSLEEIADSAENEAARQALAETIPLGPTIVSSDFDAIFFPGGHGTMYDLPENPDIQRLIREMEAANKPIAAVCHGPCCFVNVVRENGSFFVTGRNITAFTDSEERTVGLDKTMPFLLETRLRGLGANFKPAADWANHTVIDGNIVTGQNPQSSGSAAKAMIDLLESKK